MHTSIEGKLLSEGLIEKVYGTLPSAPRLALPIWAFKSPKDLFKAFVTLAEVLSSEPLVVLVDDICAQGVTGRSKFEQDDINASYISFFERLGCRVELSSVFLGSWLDILVKIGPCLTLKQLAAAMPEQKRLGFADLSCTELTHAVIELSVLKHASVFANTLVMGKFSQGMTVLYRAHTPDPLPVIITPKFRDDEHASEYCSRLRYLVGHWEA